MTFGEHLARQRGNITKARREYMRERRWFGDEWYAAWERGLAAEVECALRERAR